ncbi:Glucosyltransferase-like protein [Puccinia graminis f. sp. tritici]|uniref:dolichyl-P-Glc:Man9GlcNAc2-PP-dolichol alpha-1,3-glucosyltransferase n=1 Tax=Puccinia graminis f. sp. tritici TaxID=56615 RepID=A0A5B0PM71_PUCGR|nr:Glucosyltransferase-like protein [Puccinia graminis f. sp. tritici]
MSSSSSSLFPNSTHHHASHQEQQQRRSKQQLEPPSALRLRSRQNNNPNTHQRRVSTHSTSSTILTNITSSETYSSLLKQIRKSSPSNYHYQEEQRLMIASYGAQSPIRKTIGSFIKAGQSRSSIIAYSILFILLWKSLVGLGPYSGYRCPPLFGDLEAQRHWMAVTVELKLKQWYSFDLEYWGLDYPPLTAYHSLLLGYVARIIDPAFVLLRPPSDHPNGWGEELHDQLKVFLRSTVLASELLLWIPIVLIYHFKTFSLNSSSSSVDQSNHLSQESNPPRLSNGLWLGAIYSALVLLLNPNLILIDNAHFQFNSIMLGFTLASVTCFYSGHDLLGAVMFVCSLAFKQMALYYSPAIFAYLFGKCLYLGHPRGTKLFTRLALISTSTTILLFGPFIFNADFPQAIIQVIQRIFPIGRGLFEDKVGNFWCTLNLFIKVRTLASVKTLANIALLFTLAAVLPVTLLLIILSWKLNPSRSSVSSSSSKFPLLPADQSSPIPKTIELLPLALYNSSIGFYLFSFQVHEKSILLPVLPLLLILSRHHRNRKRGQLVNRLDWDIICLISNVSVFSMWPLLKREELGIQYLVSIVSYNHLIGYNPLKLIRRSTRNLITLIIMFIYLAMIGIHLSEKLTMPPSRLPDLFVVLNQSLSFATFSVSYLWSLLRIYEEAWTLVGFGRLSQHPPETGHPNLTKVSEEEHDQNEIEKDEVGGGLRSEVDEEDEDEESSEALNVKLPAKRSSSLQQQRRKKKSGSDSEGEELKSRSFGATPRMLKVGPLPQRMLKEPTGSGNRASSKVMISSPSGEKLMNRIKNRLHVAASRSASPSSSSSASHRSSSLEDRRRTSGSSKGKEKEDDHELDDQGGNQADGRHLNHSSREPAEYHHPPQSQSHHIHSQNLMDLMEGDEAHRQVDKQKQEEEQRGERRKDQREREKEIPTPSSPYRLESAWELALRQSREEAIRRRREELLATRTPTNSSSKR